MRAEAKFEKTKEKKGKKTGKGRKSDKSKKAAEVEAVEGEQESPPFKLPVLPVPLKDLKRAKGDPIQIEPIDLQFIESDQDIIKLIGESITAYTEQTITKLHNKCIKEALVKLIEDTKPEEVEEEEKPKKSKKSAPKASKSSARGEFIYNPKDKESAYVCPVWTPPTPRAHASILYLYFRRVWFSHSFESDRIVSQIVSFDFTNQ